MRQAVVVIHGVGDQRPMSTLRAFVKRVSGGKKFYNKPDTLSTNFELRMLRLIGERDTPPTDFYELYWAHHMRNTTPYMVFVWVSTLFSKTKLFSFQTRLLLSVAHILTALLLLFIILFALRKDILPSIITSYISLPYLIVALASVWVLFCRQVYETVGKAARYLNRTPYNVEERNLIRRDGYQLLKKLHNCRRYDRIIVVGHSLGSVIAYDVITDFWAKNVFPSSNNLNSSRHTALKNYRNAVRLLLKKEIDAKKFQRYQNELWHEFRETGLPWLITDLITIGSPLTHAYPLLSDDEASFCDKVLEKEFVICPPLFSEKKDSWINIGLRSDNRSNVWFPPNDFPFCCVRWNNIFFKHRFLFWGDPIGGKIADVFGVGICDRAVLPGIFDFWTCHIRYWKSAKKSTQESVKHLVDSMKLGFTKKRCVTDSIIDET